MFGDSAFEVAHSRQYQFIDLRGDSRGHTLVLLHGMFGGLSNFDPLLKRIQDHPVFVPEIPIYKIEHSRLNIPGLSEWLHQVLRKQQIRQPILLGNSMGGHIALQYALNHPDDLSGLVLTGSSGLFENDLGSSRPRRYDRTYVKERASLTFYEDLVNDTIIDEILDVLQDPSKLGSLLRVARSTHGHNLEDELGRIEHPVLLVWGKNDVITPPEVARQFRKKLPNATLRWIDRCGHAPMMERPEEFVKVLMPFLQLIGNRKEKEGQEHHEEDYTHF
ncbi:MAG: alpha/beta hydrolase [Balneolaceae bacterium]|nr:alpha/beta hydrolase [Balneolaceae bacterium]